jgi:hypothetical protein
VKRYTERLATHNGKPASPRIVVRVWILASASHLLGRVCSSSGNLKCTDTMLRGHAIITLCTGRIRRATGVFVGRVGIR